MNLKISAGVPASRRLRNRLFAGYRLPAFAAMSLLAMATAPVYSQIVVNGTLAGDTLYGANAPGTSALSTQTITTSFGTGNQLDAVYAAVDSTKLYLFFSGNLQANGNFFQLWVDDGRAGGQNTLSGIPATAGSMNKMNGSTFSPGFNATYGLEMNISGGNMFLDQFNFITHTATYIGSVGYSGSVATGTLAGVGIGFNNTNVAGIAGNSAGVAADQTAAQAVATGIEISIPLAQLGNPTTGIKILGGINGSNDSGLSNQMMPGLPVGSGNVKAAASPYFFQGVGSPTAGTGFNFSSLPNEYVTVPIVVVPNGNWLPAGGGSWGGTTNWSNAYIPHLAGDSVTFSTATADAVVTLDGTRTVGTLNVNDNSAAYTIAPGTGTGNKLIMDNGASGAAINNFGGVHTISADVTLNSTTTVLAQNHGDAVIMSGNIDGPGGLVISNSGQYQNTLSALFVSGTNTYMGSTNIDRGELQLQSDRALPTGNVLTIDSPSPHGELDLNGHSITVSQLVSNGFAAANSNNPPALVKNLAASGNATVTYAGSNGTPSVFNGQITDSSSTGGSVTTLVVASGSLTIGANCTYGGATVINAGASLALIPNNPAVPITSPATVVLPAGNNIKNDGNLTIAASVVGGNLTGAGTTKFSSAEPTGHVESGGRTIVQNVPVFNSVSVTTDGMGHPLGLVDITTNDMIIHNGDAASLDALAKSWWANGARNGTGLGTSAATAETFTTVAVFPNDANDGLGDPYYSTYGNLTLAPTDVIIRFAYMGDTNVDGVLNAADLAKIVEGASVGATGWQNGDINYDGIVDAADVALFLPALDAYNNGLPTLGQIAGGGNGSGSVPEPTSLGLLLAAPMLMSRRRR